MRLFIFLIAYKVFRRAVFAWLFLLASSQLFAATYYSRATNVNFTATSGVWSTSRSGGTIVNTFPGTSHTYIIQNTHNIRISATTTASQVTVESGGTLTVYNANRSLTTNLIINAGGSLALTTWQLTLNGTLNNSGTLSGTSGYLITNTNTVTNSGTISLTTGRIVRTTGALTNNGAITLGAGQFTATTGALTNSGTITVTGTATITLGTGNFTNNNSTTSVNFGSSAVALTGTLQSIGGFVTTGAITATNASGTITLTGGIRGSTFTKSGAGTIDMGSGTHIFTGAFALGTTGTVNGGSSTINVNAVSATAWSGTGSVFVPGTSTVVFGGNGNQTISATGTSTFYNLNTLTSGTKQLGTTTVNNALTVGSGTTVATGANTLTLAGSGTPLVDNGTFTASTNSTVIYSGATANIAGETYFNLQTSTAGVKTMADNSTVQGVLTVDAASELNLSNRTLTLSAAGTPLVVSGTFSPGTSTVNFTNSNSVNIPAINFYNLNGTGGPRVFASTGTIGIANTFTPGAGAFTTAGSTISFNGAAQTIPAFTFNNVKISNSGAKLINGIVNVKNIEIENGPTLDINSTGSLNILP